jgi:acetyltransferase-like isoleucine patch superfamily enzyme
MITLLRRLYKKFCYKVYSNGLLEYKARQYEQLTQTLSFGEGTRFYERSRIMNFSNNPERIILGSNCHIYGMLTVFNYGGKIEIGNHCSVGEYSRIVSGKNITIGNRVMIAHNVNILDNNSHPKSAHLRHEDFVTTYAGNSREFDLESAEIVIEDDVWIGFNSIILKGVRIGQGAIIGAGSIVVKDVEPWTVNVGNPLRCVQKLQPENN